MSLNKKRIGTSILFFILLFVTVYSALAVDDSFTPILNSSCNLNSSSENLTAYGSDIDKNIFEWKKNGEYTMLVNLPFEGGSNSTWTKDYTSYNPTIIAHDVEWLPSGGFDGKGAYYFDGDASDEDYVRILKSGLDDLLLENFTISMWFDYNGSIQPGSTATLFSSSYTWRLSIHSVTNDKIGFYNLNGAWWGTTIPAEGWNKVDFTKDGDVIKIYMNGELKNTSTVTNTPAPSNYIYVGSYGTNQYGFNGTIDEVKLYNYGLTEEQISRKYYEDINSINTSTLVSQETTYGDNWSVCITANNGSVDSSEKCTGNITIAPSFASITNYSLYPTVNVTSIETLYGNATYNQDENFSGYIQIDWYVNDILTYSENSSTLNNGESNTFSLNPNFISSNDNVYFKTVGYVTGESICEGEVTSNNVTIINSNYTLTRVTPSDLNITIVEPNSQLFKVGLTDIDDDVTINWYSNGELLNDTGTTYTFEGNYDSSGVYTILASASDGEYNQSISWDLTVENSQAEWEFNGLLGLIVLLATLLILYGIVSQDNDFSPLKLFFLGLVPFVLLMIIRYAQSLVEVSGNESLLSIFDNAYFISMMLITVISIYIMYILIYKIIMFLARRKEKKRKDMESIS